jgi:transposase-like protein
MPQSSPRTKKSYSAEAKTRALIVLAARAGNCAEACKETDVPVETLRSWKKTDEYERIRHDYGHRLEEFVIAEIRERMVEQSELEKLALDKTREALENDEIKDPARTMRDIAHAKSQNIDKLRVMTGRPTDITEHRSLDELVKALSSLGIAKVDSEPIVEGELVSGE